MINNKSIGRKLKELRTSRDLKQSELADLVGLSRPAISNIESGKRSLTLSTLKRFCEVYGIDISYFELIRQAMMKRQTSHCASSLCFTIFQKLRRMSYI